MADCWFTSPPPLATPPSFLFAGMQAVRSGSCNVTDEKRQRDTVSMESNKERRGAAESRNIWTERHYETKGYESTTNMFSAKVKEASFTLLF